MANMAKLARNLGYDRSNFRRAVIQLCENDLVSRIDTQYSLNLDCKTWQINKNTLYNVRKRMNIDINKQLSS